MHGGGGGGLTVRNVVKLLLWSLSLSSLIPSNYSFNLGLPGGVILRRQTTTHHYYSPQHHHHQQQYQQQYHLHTQLSPFLKMMKNNNHNKIETQHRMTSESTVISSNLGEGGGQQGGDTRNEDDTNINNDIDSAAATAVVNIVNDKSNWRIIPATTDTYQPYMNNRQEWTNIQLQDSLQLYHSFMSCTDSYIAPIIQDALNTLDHAYRLYGPESVICSFNGGKDAVVILHLLRAAHAKYYDSIIITTTTTNNNNENDPPINIYRPRVIYFENNDEFPEVLEFLKDSVHGYDLDMMAFQQGVKFSDGLKILVEHNYLDEEDITTDSSSSIPNNNNNNRKKNRPFPMAFCLGTRTSDPNAAGQEIFAPSSHYMPPFMRVNPILNWTYGHVWHFLRVFQLPYCSLYDEGYTSLGSTKDTLPCPALQVVASNRPPTTSTTTTDAEGETDNNNNNHLPKFWPAYMLKDWDQERAGRIKKEKKSTATVTTTTTTTTTATTTVLSSTLSSTADNKNNSTIAPPRRNKKSSIPRSESYMSTVSDLRKSDPSPLLQVDTTQLEQGTCASVAGSFDNTMSAATTTNKNANEGEVEEDTVFTMDSLPEAYGSDVDSEQEQQAPKTVGILIIGDEILKGLTLDINTNVAAKALRKENVVLQRVVVCSDDQEEIVKDIQRMIEEDKVDVIITSGGIGPTHDDVTVKSVAAALNRELILNKEMVDLLVSKMENTTTKNNNNCTTATSSTGSSTGSVPNEQELTDAQIKMATLPSNSKLRYFSDDNDWPILQCRNIFILPGVPQFFADKIESIASYLSSSHFERSVAYKIVLSVDEASIVDILNSVVSKHPDVNFGSYPFVSHPEFKTVVTLEASYPQTPAPMLPNRNVTGGGSGSGNRFAAVTGTGSFVIATSSKDQRDRQVRLALDDLITKLPKGSILRVENDDLTTFT